MSDIILRVGVKALIKRSDGKFLVLERSAEKYPEVPNPWDIPGGRIDPGKTLVENLAREIKEETGLMLVGEPTLIAAQDVLRIAGKHTVRLTYLAEVEPGEPKLDGQEHTRFEWFTLDDFRTRKGVDIYVKEVVEKFL